MWWYFKYVLDEIHFPSNVDFHNFFGWLLLNFQSQELPIILWNFISLRIWIFLIEFPIPKIIQNSINSHNHRFEIWKSKLVHVDLWRAFQLCCSNCTKISIGYIGFLQSDKLVLLWVNGWLLKRPFYTLVLSIHASKKSSISFCGDDPNNYNIKGNIDLQMLIHDTLFLLISQLEKKL
jgi:hypothetical protein